AAYTDKFNLWQEGAIKAVMELKNCAVDTAKTIIHDFKQQGFTTKAFYHQLQEWATPKTIIDKTPSYALDLRTLKKIAQDFDNPIFIHLVRHPYSMVNSFEKYHMEQVLYLKPHNYTSKELGELVWLKSHQNILNLLENVPQNRRFSLRYEDLVQQPKIVLEKLCQQIGLDFHDQLLTPYKNIQQQNINGIHADSRSMSDSNLLNFKGINAQKAEEWKAALEDNFLSDTTWQVAEKLGYETLRSETQGLSPSRNDFGRGKTSVSNIKSSPNHTTDIAIIGMSCRVAGANTLHEFWMNLVNGTDVSTAVTAEELTKAGLDANLLNQSSHVARKLSLDNFDCFDAPFFGYHPNEAKMMDPQHRVLLEVAYAALENAGYNPFDYEGKIGIFGGVAKNTYFTNNIATHPDLLADSEEYTSILGSEKTFSISRIAYKLNLKGPAVNVQTACSTSGTAVHLACQSILNGDSDMVIVGGGRIHPELALGYEYTEGGPLSPDGYLRAFDADAKGMVRGNGMVSIVLKKLDQALEDRDHIWAVIKGTAINNDGSDKIGFTAPSINGQAEAITKALAKARLNANDIDYIEAHGTGTILGDPIEVAGLTKAFEKTTDNKQFCAIGSVKTAIGHLDAGSCIAGIIKTALALKYELLPPSLNFEKPNPQIDFANSPFYVNDKLSRWERGERLRRAGVSSFGLGGTNAHIILEESPQPIISNKTATKPNHHLLLLSAKSEEVLAEQQANLAEFLARKEDIDLTDVAYTLATGRATFAHRSAKIGSIKISSFGKDLIVQNAPIVFLFPGGGAQYLSMTKGLYETYPTFRAKVDFCVDFLKQEENIDIQPFLQSSENLDLAQQIKTPTIALTTLFTVEYALAKLWQHWGIEPTQMIGHSMGEYTSACLAGVFSVEDGLRLVTLRGRLFESLSTTGGMLSVSLSEAALTPYLNTGTTISVINKPDNCTVSGSKAALGELAKRLAIDKVETANIHINVAAHSAHIDPIVPEFRAFLETIDFHPPTVPIISNLTGKWAQETEICTSQYWVNHLRQTVRFSDGLATILQQDNSLLLEVGPGQTLSTFARQHPQKNKSHFVYSSVRHPKETADDVAFILKTLGKMWCQGVDINWQNYYQHFLPNRVSLPTYPFARNRYWIDRQLAVGSQQSAVDSRQLAVGGREDMPDFKNLAYLNAYEQSEEEQNPLTNSSENMVEESDISTISRKAHLTDLIKEILFELSGLEPDEMEADATFLE
ncbi:MAG: beta-ketoacyl synthase N-terminal-like domain-containing protein, partial [Bacteroidota bacterium]